MTIKIQPHTVFCYGTLKRGHGNNRLLKDGDATFLGEAVTVNPYRLTAGGVPYMAKPFGSKPGLGCAQVLGEVWTCDDDTREDLDALEGHPDLYRREEIHVAMLGDDGRPRADHILAEAYFIQHENRGRPVALNAQGWAEWQRRVARAVAA